MEALARALIRRNVSIAVVVVSCVLAAVAGILAMNVEQDDDILAFLPPGNPDVALFYGINEEFGGLDVAIVGIEAEDLFTGEFLTQLQRTTQAINDIEEVSFALSITSVEDFKPDPIAGGIEQSPLVYPIPSGPQEEAATRERIMSRDHVVGNLVSPTGDAVNIYCFLGMDVDPRETAAAIQTVVEGYLPDRNLYWGGSPFISSWIYDTTDRDLDKLTPYAVLTILIILMLTFGDLRGTLLALLNTCMGIAAANGLMAALGVRYNIVLSSMPIILFAVGSAYSIHILSHYYSAEPKLGRDEALRRTLMGIGPTVLAAGLTTVAGLLSFLTMDIEPMRTFGLFTAVGIFSTLVLSLTFVPAVIRLSNPKRKQPRWTVSSPMVWLVRICRRHRVLMGVLIVIGVSINATFVTQVDTQMDNASFFNEGSPPDQAERFLDEHFGGSQYIQILVEGDFKDPRVQRELQYLADSLEGLEFVSDTVHAAETVALANEAMEGFRRVPDTPEKVALLLGFMTGNRTVDQLITEDRTKALLQLKVNANRADDVEAVLAEIELFVAAHKPIEGFDRPRELVVRRVDTLCKNFEVDFDAEQGFQHLYDLPWTAAEEDLVDALMAFMATDEFIAELPAEPPGVDRAVATAAARLAPDAGSFALTAAIAEVLQRPEDDLMVDDVVFSLETPLQEIQMRVAADSAAAALVERTGMQLPEGDAGQRFYGSLSSALVDLERLPESAGAANDITLAVSGLPVLHRGLSRSVNHNQWKSLATALALVLVIMMVLFRSVGSGLLATLPTFLTLLFVYGTMGMARVHLDIGTSMLACLIIGAGVDYAVHMLAAWRTPRGQDVAQGAEVAARTTAPAIWTNAAMVAAGFYVLTLGEAKPLQNVGLLTASAMLIAALTTFVAIPVMARRRSYSAKSVLDALEDVGGTQG